MKTINVDLGERSYPIHIGPSILHDQSLLQRTISSDQVLIISNEVIASLYLSQLEQYLADINYDTFILPDGEHTKNLDTFKQIMTKLLEKKYNRTCMLIALGGGVIGDLTGFVASCYQRGVAFIQIPTTLLAQVDASVGGKTAVNHELGKNMIGAFHQPSAVLADTHVIATLPDREYSAGLAEVIKYGLIRDKAFFSWLEENMSSLLRRDLDALDFIVERSCINKVAIVAEDERESGVRALLNLGHTFAHAMETALSYQDWLHGEAVGCGMLLAADLSIRLGLLEPAAMDRIRHLLGQANLPTKIHPNISLEQILTNMKVDKKARHGTVYLILLNAIGDAIITDNYTQEALIETIECYLS